MAKNSDWLPTRLADMLVMFQNVQAKIAGYEAVLPLTQAQVDRILLICDIFIKSYNYVEQARMTAQALVEWRNLVFEGSPKGDPCPLPPAFPGVPDVTKWTLGILNEFRDLVDLIKSSPGYTRSIGEDLMIVAVKGSSALPVTVTPDLKVSTATGYVVNLAGSMQGADAMRVEYKRNGGGGWTVVGFLTKLPGTVHIVPNVPGDPEIGNIRGQFTKKNADVGNASPEYPVTLS